MNTHEAFRSAPRGAARFRGPRKMSRPGFVLEVDDRTPPHRGPRGARASGSRSFPLGTRVVYPPESMPAVPDVDGAIQQALLNPVDSDPLPALLKAGMRLTIAFDDLSIPLPPMRRRRTSGGGSSRRSSRWRRTRASTTSKLIAANALHRRMTAAELKHIVGERVFRSFYPQG